jgi:hypothetical protein
MACTEKTNLADRTSSVFHANVQVVTAIAFSWGALSAGDCHQSGGTLTFRSNGTGTWQCTTWTDHTHSGDYWHCSFQVKNAGGGVLFPLGQWDSPRMSDGGPSYYWTHDFTFEPSLYGAIAAVNQTYSC